MVLVRTLKAGVGQGSSTLEFAFSDMNRTLMNLRIKSDSLFFWGVHSHSWFHYGWAQQGPTGFLMFPVLQAYQFECEEGKWYTAQGEVEKCAAQGHGFMSSALGLMLSGSLLHLVVQSRICHGFGTSLFHGDSNLTQSSQKFGLPQEICASDWRM